MQIEDIENMAKMCMEATGTHRPQIFVEDSSGKGGLAVFMLIYNSDKERDFICDAVRRTISELGVDRYWFVSDAFVGQNPFIRPVNDVGRKENLIVLEFRRDMMHKSIFNSYSRVGDKIIWNDRKFTSGSYSEDCYSCWNFFVEKSVGGEHIMNARVDFLFENAKKHVLFKDILAEGKVIGKTDDDIKLVIKKFLEVQYAKEKRKRK